MCFSSQAIKVLNDEMNCDIIKIGSIVRNKGQRRNTEARPGRSPQPSTVPCPLRPSCPGRSWTQESWRPGSEYNDQGKQLDAVGEAAGGSLDRRWTWAEEKCWRPEV